MSDFNRLDRQELDNHITGHYGEDQFREGDEDEDTPAEALAQTLERQPGDMAPPYDFDPAPRTYHSDRLGAVTIPED